MCGQCLARRRVGATGGVAAGQMGHGRGERVKGEGRSLSWRLVQGGRGEVIGAGPEFEEFGREVGGHSGVG